MLRLLASQTQAPRDRRLGRFVRSLALATQEAGSRPNVQGIGLRFPRNRALASDAAADQAAAADRAKAVVLSKRLPEDFVENTLLPHLESQLLNNIHVYTPAELAKIARAYSQQEVTQYALSQKLADTVRTRIDGFEAVDIVDILGAIWILIPGDDDLFESIEARILEKLEDFSALNLMGIVRIFNKRASKHHDLLSKVLPQLRSLLQDYEAMELSDMLVSMAQSAEAASDMDILMTLVPEVERRYNEVSLVHAINNIWALTSLKVIHPRLLEAVARDLGDPKKSKDLTPAFMSRIVWVYRRCNSWDKVSGVMLPLIRASAAEFRCGEFARLAQALPEEQSLLQRIADALQPSLQEMGRKEFMLFFLGCVHGELLETNRKEAAEPSALAFECLQYVRDEQDNFKREEVQKIVYLLKHAPKYEHLLDDLPVSWNATKEQTLDYIRAKG